MSANEANGASAGIPAAQVAAPEGAVAAVAAALARLQTLDDTPVAEHVEVFDEVHRDLQDALATLDEA